MQRARNEFLACATLAQNQHTGVGGGDGLNHPPQGAHGGAFAHDLGEISHHAGGGAQTRIFLQQTMALSTPCHGVQQFLRRKGLGQIIHRPGPDGFHRKFGRGVGGDHQDRQVRPVLTRPGQKLVTGHSAQPRVGDDHEKPFIRQQSQPFLGRFDIAHGIALITEEGAQREAHVPFVIHNEHRRQGSAHGENVGPATRWPTSLRTGGVTGDACRHAVLDPMVFKLF